MKYLAFLVTLLLSGAAFSQTNTWTGATDTDWHKACNWSLNVIPTCSHDVVIPNNTTNKPVITGIAHCKTIDVQSTSAVLLEVTSSGTLSVGDGGSCSGTALDNGGCCTTAEWIVNSNPSTRGDRATAIAIDANYMYVCGEDRAVNMSDIQWRIEKRSLTNGALVTGFGTNGVVLSNYNTTYGDHARGIAIDGTYMYVCGNDATSSLDWNWRIEKRNLSNGALVTAFTGPSPSTAGTFRYSSGTSEYAVDIAANGTNIFVVGAETGSGVRWHIKCINATSGAQVWAQNSDPSSGADIPAAIAVDASGVYIAGVDAVAGDDRWRVEKRSLTNGTLIGTFGSGGVVTSNFNSGKDYMSDIAVDATGIYVLGYVDPSPNTFTYQWRIEKRNLTTGALITTFGTNGAVMVDPSAKYDAAFGLSVYNGRIYVVGNDQTTTWIWRTETFDATTGASICAQTAGNTTGNAVAANASGAFGVGWGLTTGLNANEQWKIVKLCNCP